MYVPLVPPAKPIDVAGVQSTLSAARMSTYIAAAAGDSGLALELYGWNARVSAALMLPAHFAEVATRNAVSDALTTVYGPRWPWSTTFTASLPAPPRGYDPRRDLSSVRTQEPTTGKVIAELKFVFWQKMFTARHDTRVWDRQIENLFPNAKAASPAELRKRIYDDLDAIRLLRNRIAHHEPIFTRNLTDDLAKMLDLVETRSTATAAWVREMEEVSGVLAERP